MSEVKNGFERPYTGGDNAMFINDELIAAGVNFTIVTGGVQHECDVQIDILDGHGNILPGLRKVSVFFVDSSYSMSTEIDTAIMDGAGTVVASYTDAIWPDFFEGGEIVTDVNGQIKITITDDAVAPSVYVAVHLPNIGQTFYSRELVDADFKA